MCSLEALIFDVDGTLAETERAHLVAFNRAFADAGLDWFWSQSLYGELLAVSGSAERLRHYIDVYRPPLKGNEDPSTLVDRLREEKDRHYCEMVRRREVRLRSGVGRLISEARDAQLRLAIASTARVQNITALLEATLGPDSAGWFELVAGGDAVPNKKPSPDVYHFVLDELGVPPNGCIAFEDSANGVRAASAAGVTTVVTVSDFTAHDEFSGAAVVLDSLGEPDSPFRVIAGEVDGAIYVDLTFLRWLQKKAS